MNVFECRRDASWCNSVGVHVQWSTSVGTELRMHAGDGQTTTATCNDDEGAIERTFLPQD